MWTLCGYSTRAHTHIKKIIHITVMNAICIFTPVALQPGPLAVAQEGAQDRPIQVDRRRFAGR